MNQEDYFRIGFNCRDLVYGIKSLERGESLRKSYQEAFIEIIDLLKHPNLSDANRGFFRRYVPKIIEKEVEPYGLTKRLLTVLERKNILLFEEGELEIVIGCFKHLANCYILKMQGINRD